MRSRQGQLATDQSRHAAERVTREKTRLPMFSSRQTDRDDLAIESKFLQSKGDLLRIG